VVVSIIDADGERTFVTAPGAEATLTAADLAAVQARPADAVYLSGYGLAYPSNRTALLDWLRRLPDANLVLLDPGPLAAQIPPAALADVLARADWLTCNAREAALLSGQPDPLAAARMLAAQPRRGGIIVRSGPEGCLLARPGAEILPVPGFPVRVTDTNGAGDTHTGTFLAALAQGGDPAAAARIANAAAALSVTRRAPLPRRPRPELADFLSRQP